MRISERNFLARVFLWGFLSSWVSLMLAFLNFGNAGVVFALLSFVYFDVWIAKKKWVGCK